ncbi:MAG TPA: hypothetical protein VGB83_05065 [Actinomycetota bacterium]
MEKRGIRVAIMGLVAAVSTLGSTAPAAATHACVTYSVTTPVTGTITDTKCSPVNLPPFFNDPFTHHSCKGSGTLGVEVCVDIDAHLFLP